MPTHTRVESGMAQDQRWISNFFGRPDQRWHVRPKPGGWQTDPNMQPGGVCHHWSEVHLLSRCSERSCQVHQRFDPRTGTPPPSAGAAGKWLMSGLNFDRDEAVYYLDEGAQWLHIRLLCVQEGHHHMFPHVLRRWRKRRRQCFSSIFDTHITYVVLCVCVCVAPYFRLPLRKPCTNYICCWYQ